LAIHEEHRAKAPKVLRIAVITVSTSRYQSISKGVKVTDESGDRAIGLLKSFGHDVVSKKIVDDNSEMIRNELLNCIYKDQVQVVVLTGGTGISKRDVTIESVRPLLDKEIYGFGEVFRSKSYEKIGAPALLTRSLAGTINGRLVFCLPGSPDAVETGLQLILPELPHAFYIASSP